MQSDHTPSHGSNFSPIDHSVLRRLEEDVADGNPEIMLELIDIFLLDSGRHIDEIARDWEKREFRKIEMAAHSIKSSSATFGAMALSALSAQTEQLAHARQSEGMAEMLRSLHAEFARAEAVLVVEREKWREAAAR